MHLINLSDVSVARIDHLQHDEHQFDKSLFSDLIVVVGRDFVWDSDLMKSTLKKITLDSNQSTDSQTNDKLFKTIVSMELVKEDVIAVSFEPYCAEIVTILKVKVNIVYTDGEFVSIVCHNMFCFVCVSF